MDMLRREMIEEINRLTKEIWEKAEKETIKTHYTTHYVVRLGWHGGYEYYIRDGNLIYPFAEPLKYLSKWALSKILNVLLEYQKTYREKVKYINNKIAKKVGI